jgi:aryl-alcohol dehydrogenase-like predicted oxidoreductase
MKYRYTRDRSLRFSEIGLGTYALAGVYGRKDPVEFARVVKRALDLGVTCFDSAPVYGEGERLLGEVLAGVRKEILLSTKVAAGVDKGFSCSFDAIVASCDESLGRLKTDYIDLYQIHFDDGKTPTEEVVRAMEHLRAAGKIRAYGIGHVSYERAAEYLTAGKVATVMGELSAASRKYHAKMVPLIRKHGVGYIGFSLTGRGVLTGAVNGRDGLEEGDIRTMDALFAGAKLASALKIKAAFAQASASLGATPAQIAILWALAQEGVVTGLVGPSTVAHLEEDAGASDLEPPASLIRELDAFVASEEARLQGDLRKEVASILKEPMTDVSQAPKLIYALESLSELELAPEEDLIGCFKQLLAVMHGGADAGVLEALRGQLLRYVRR